MTLILGVRFHDGVGIAGDTRAVSVNPLNPQKIIKADNYCKVYYLSPFIFGISGNAYIGSLLLIEYLREVAYPYSNEFLLSKALDLEWITNFFKIKYREIISKKRLNDFPLVGLMIASCEFKPNNSTIHKSKNREMNYEEYLRESGFSSSAMSEAVKNLVGNQENKISSMLITLTFPDEKVKECNPLETIMMGSGKNIDSNLRRDIKIISPEIRDASIATRMQSLLGSWTATNQKNNDEHFNSIVHSIVLDPKQVRYLGHHTIIYNDYYYSVNIASKYIFPMSEKDFDNVFSTLIRELRKKDQSRNDIETFHDGEYWWILDYKNNRKSSLVNILMEVATNEIDMLKESEFIL